MLNIGTRGCIMRLGWNLQSALACTLITEKLVESIITYLLYQKEMDDYGE